MSLRHSELCFSTKETIMATQQQIAEHLGLSQQAVSKQLSKMGIDWKVLTLDQIRLAYIERLRKSAAGQTDEYMKVKLAREKIETERVLIALKKEKGELVDIDELIPTLRTVFSGFKQRLLEFPAMIRSEVFVTTGKEIDELPFAERCEEILRDCNEYINSYSQTIANSREGGGSSG